MGRRRFKSRLRRGRDGRLTCRACGTPATSCGYCYARSCPSCTTAVGGLCMPGCGRPPRPPVGRRAVAVVVLFADRRRPDLGGMLGWYGIDRRTARRATRRLRREVR